MRPCATSARRRRRAISRPAELSSPVRILIAKTDSSSTSDNREMKVFDPLVVTSCSRYCEPSSWWYSFASALVSRKYPLTDWATYRRSSRDVTTVSDKEPRMPERARRTVSRLMSSCFAAAHSSGSKQSAASAIAAASEIVTRTRCRSESPGLSSGRRTPFS